MGMLCIAVCPVMRNRNGGRGLATQTWYLITDSSLNFLSKNLVLRHRNNS